MYLFLSQRVCMTQRLMPGSKQISVVLLIYRFALPFNSLEGQRLVDMREECFEDGDIDKCNNTSDSSGFFSCYKSNTESELGSFESISLRRQPQQEVIPGLAAEPPPISPRRKWTSSLSPDTLKMLNAYSSRKFTHELLPSRPRNQSISPPSPPPTPPALSETPPPLPPRQNKSPKLLHYMLRPHSSSTPSTPIANSSSETGLPSSQPPSPKTKYDPPSSPDQPLQKPSQPPDQQVSTKPQEVSTLPTSFQTFLSASSHQVTPSSSIVDTDSPSWPRKSLPHENLERTWYE